MLIKQISLSFCRNLDLGTSCELLIMFSAKVNSLFIGLEVLSSASVKAKLFAKNFSKNSNCDDSGISVYCLV